MSGNEKSPNSLIGLLQAQGQPLSPELTELLAAYGPPPEMPAYQGSWQEYGHAVSVFERLSATPEAAARRNAIDRYFAKWGEGHEVSPPDSDTDSNAVV